MKYSAVIVAAGASTRFNGDINKLLYVMENGMTVIENTLQVFLEDEDCSQMVVVTNDEVRDFLIKKDRAYGRVIFCYGGETRQESVYHGLLAVKEPFVLVHDGARCFLNRKNLDNLKQQVDEEHGAILCKKVTDTVKIIDGGQIDHTIDRNSVKLAETPQGFPTDALIRCYEKAFKKEFTGTDDAQLMEKFGRLPVRWVESIGNNTKITYIEDIREDK